MLRTTTIAMSLATVFSLATAAAVSADTTPNPPPGSINVQPVNVTANGTGSSAGHCGAQAAGTTVQPMQVSSSGASSPSGCGSTTTAGSPAKSTQNRSQSTGSNNGGSSNAGALKAAGAMGPGLSGVSDLVSGGSGPNFGYVLFLLLLIALLLVLFGFAIGRRRPAAVRA